MAENYFRQSIMLAQGSWAVFIERPISLTFLILMVLTVAIGVFGKTATFRNLPLVRSLTGSGGNGKGAAG